MRYALLLYAEAAAARATTREQSQVELDRYIQITESLALEGVLRGGEAFHPASLGRRVRLDSGQVVMGEVPDHELELSGFLLVECNEERAHAIAADLPVATHGQVEVRPLMELPPPPAAPLT